MAEEEKKCKYCAMMIPKEAKICPHCRKKMPISYGAGCAIIVVFGFLLVWGMASSPIMTTTTTLPPPNADPSTVSDDQVYREFEVCMNLAKGKVDRNKVEGQAIAANCMGQLKKYGDKRAKKAFATYFDSN